MATYTPEQLKLYFEHLGIEMPIYDNQSPDKRLEVLTFIQQSHLARVSFDSVALHYSPTRILSLDPEDLFQKIVVNSRGGYCMEVNTLFGAVLRSIGYTVVSVGGRVKHKKWSHMVNIVTIGDSKYLVDVGFGAGEPTQPVPLKHGYEFSGLLSSKGRLEFKHLDRHSATAKEDPAQRLWVYSVKKSSTEKKWEEMYSFTETEFFPDDFVLMSYFVSTRPDSWFVQEMVAYRMLMDSGSHRLSGEVALHKDVLKIRDEGKEEIVTKLNSEDDRIKALAHHFKMKLTEREQRSIVGLVSEIRKR